MNHHCHAHACETPVPPTMLMCRKHWAMVPNPLRFPVLRTYRRGQCADRRPSAAYMAAQRACVAYVARLEGHTKAADDYAQQSAKWAARAAAQGALSGAGAGGNVVRGTDRPGADQPNPTARRGALPTSRRNG